MSKKTPDEILEEMLKSPDRRRLDELLESLMKFDLVMKKNGKIWAQLHPDQIKDLEKWVKQTKKS